MFYFIRKRKQPPPPLFKKKIKISEGGLFVLQVQNTDSPSSNVSNGMSVLMFLPNEFWGELFYPRSEATLNSVCKNRWGKICLFEQPQMFEHTFWELF